MLMLRVMEFKSEIIFVYLRNTLKIILKSWILRFNFSITSRIQGPHADSR